jgi:predicted metal-binding membrane protein
MQLRSPGPAPTTISSANLSPTPAAGATPYRDRVATIAPMALLAALAWAVVIFWSRSSSMMDAMPGRATATGALLFAGMWLVMMAAMMLPATTVPVLHFRAWKRRRGARSNMTASTAAFVCAYLAVWTLAGIAADLTFILAQAAGTRLHAGRGIVPVIGGTIVLVAGIYQLSPLKLRCLAHCRPPFHAIAQDGREGRLSVLRMGASHGAHCLGCCWGIMAVLFVVGLMNLAWMAALSVLILVEKVVPKGTALGRLIGVAFMVLGVCISVQPRLIPASGLQSGDTSPMSGMTPAPMPSPQP